MKKFKTSDIVRVSLLVLLILISIGLSIYFFPQLKELATAEGREKLMLKLESYGALKHIVFIGIQILQVIIAFIPGEPIELIGGALFGWWMALILCLLGTLLGTIIVFYLVKLLGKPFINIIIPEEKISKFRFLNDSRKLKLTIFILYLIPGTPKDVLTYCAPLTPIRPLHFFIIVTFARIPSVISSNIIGSSVSSGNWVLSLIVTIITGALGICGIWFSNKLVKKFEESERIRKLKEKRTEIREKFEVIKKRENKDK